MTYNLIYLTSSGAQLRGRKAVLAWVYDTVQYNQACIDTYVGKLNIVNILQMRDPRFEISEILTDIFKKHPEIRDVQVYFGDELQRGSNQIILPVCLITRGEHTAGIVFYIIVFC